VNPTHHRYSNALLPYSQEMGRGPHQVGIGYAIQRSTVLIQFRKNSVDIFL
jgi:hypothetical protein